MRVVKLEELEMVNGGDGLISTIVRWGDELVHAAVAVIDSVQLEFNSRIASNAEKAIDYCGKSNVKSVSNKGYECFVAKKTYLVDD